MYVSNISLSFSYDYSCEIFREAKLLDMLNNLMAPYVRLIGLPKEVSSFCY